MFIRILISDRFKYLLAGLVLILLAGCAGKNFEYQPGTEIPKGPGVFTDEEEGKTIYKSKERLFKKSEEDKGSSEVKTEAKDSDEYQEFQKWKQESEEFKQFQEWKNTKEGSSEYQEFLEWKKWREYRKWKESQKTSE